MKQLPQGLQDHLNAGTTTLCWCWKLTRNDGTIQGFTDHDNDLTFNATTYKAATGFTASELNESIGLNINNMDIDGVLQSASLAEEDLSSGLYDNATIEIYRVNWSDTTQHILMRKGSIGEVKRSENSFTAEIRSLAHNLQQPKGRLYQYGCDATLGDTRCKIDLNLSAYKATGIVDTVINERTFTTTDLETHQTEHFTSGKLTWPSGASHEVKYHTALNSIITIELWHQPVTPILPGNTFEITAGCDKQFKTCQTKFNNALNFRGCPHMPGNDFTLSYPNKDDGTNNGNSLQQQ